MGIVTRWGERPFKKGNAEDEAVKKAILQKILDLGEDPNDKKNHMKPEKIHELDAAWQQYSTKAFGTIVRKCCAIISK